MILYVKNAEDVQALLVFVHRFNNGELRSSTLSRHLVGDHLVARAIRRPHTFFFAGMSVYFAVLTLFGQPGDHVAPVGCLSVSVLWFSLFWPDRRRWWGSPEDVERGRAKMAPVRIGPGGDPMILCKRFFRTWLFNLDGEPIRPCTPRQAITTTDPEEDTMEVHRCLS